MHDCSKYNIILGLILLFLLRSQTFSRIPFYSLDNLYGHSVQVFEHFETCTDTDRSVRSGGYAHVQDESGPRRKNQETTGRIRSPYDKPGPSKTNHSLSERIRVPPD